MVNEDIVTALKNAIEHGESLESAMLIAVNSGYNPRDIQEASKFVGEGVISIQKIAPDEMLTMPNKKGFFSKMFSSKPKPQMQSQTQPQQKPMDKQSNIEKPLPTQPISQQPMHVIKQEIQPQKTKQIPSQDYYQQPMQIIPPQAPIKPVSSIPFQQLPSQQTSEQIKQNIEAPLPSSQTQPSQLYKPRTMPKKSYAKEIILLIILLVLIGILIVTVRYKNEIINFFSG